MLILSAGAVFLAANWFTYVWAVNHGEVVQASLGYYTNPLVSVMLGVVVLSERLAGSSGSRSGSPPSPWSG